MERAKRRSVVMFQYAHETPWCRYRSDGNLQGHTGLGSRGHQCSYCSDNTWDSHRSPPPLDTQPTLMAWCLVENLPFRTTTDRLPTNPPVMKICTPSSNDHPNTSSEMHCEDDFKMC